MYAESVGGSCAFCATCGGRIAAAAKYFVLDALTDYYDEIGGGRASADSIRARCLHMRDFLALRDRREMVCADIDEGFAAAFRQWSSAQPVKHRNGQGVVTRERQRSPATTEESLIILRAALNHAKRKRRIEDVPFFRTLGRERVSNPNITRIDLATIARMLAYASNARGADALHSFIVATVCTLARPDAVFDMSVLPERRQWREGDHLMNLNPFNRIQTSKRRPIVAVPAQLRSLLHKALADPAANGWVVHWRGERVQDVDSSWATMLRALGLPEETEYRSYILRRSMATILRNRHQRDETVTVDFGDLESQMGHKRRSQTEIYALPDPSYDDSVQRSLRGILEEIERLAPGCFHREITGATVSKIPV